MRLYFDIETDGLLDTVSKIHTLVIRDLDAEVRYSFADQPGYQPISRGLRMLEQAEEISGHNILGFDIPAIRKVTGMELKAKPFDTLVASRLIWSDMKAHDLARIKRDPNYVPGNMIGRHSLEAWGYRLKQKKLDFGKTADWTKWSPAMQVYCEGDVETGAKLDALIRSKNYSQEALDLEHDFAAIILQQEWFGWAFDIEAAERLYADLAGHRAALIEKLRDVFPSRWETMKTPEYFTTQVTTPFGTTPLSFQARTKTEAVDQCWDWAKPLGHRRRDIVAIPGPLKKKEIPFNPGSRDQIASRLKEHGWIPTKFTDTGKPQIDETVLEEACQDIDNPAIKLLGQYLLVSKRIGQVAEGDKAWLKLVKNGRIHGRINTNGAVTGRCTHNDPNVSQVPSVTVGQDGKPLLGITGGWGYECRACFTADPGYVLVGADASGLELRDLAHYMGFYDGGAYGRVLLEGDIHMANTIALGLEPTKANRNNISKTFIYAYLYGAGDLKLGKIAGVTPDEIEEFKVTEKARWAKAVAMIEKQEGVADDRTVGLTVKGAILRSRFENNTEALAKLKQAIDLKITEPAWKPGFRKLKKDATLRGLDGRILPIRSRHASLNTLLQSAGAILMKKATVLLYQKLLAKGFTFGKEFANVAHVHDEVQIQTLPHLAEEVGRLAVASIREAGEHFRFRVPLDGEFKVGKNWALTH